MLAHSQLKGPLRVTLFVLSRLLRAIVVFFFASVLIFTLVQAVPGDPAKLKAGPEGTPATIDAMRIEIGLDGSYVSRLGRFLEDTFVHFDLGESWRTDRAVSDESGARLARTMTLVGLALLLGIALGPTLAAATVLRRGKWLDRAVSTLAHIGAALLPVWLAALAILVFSVKLGWLPAFGLGGVVSYILPLLCLALPVVAITFLQARASLTGSSGPGDVSAAGATERQEGAAKFGTAFKQGLVSLVGRVGAQVSFLFGWAVLVESIFAVPGIGRLFMEGLNNRDLEVVRGALLVMTAVVVVAAFLADIAHALLDPHRRRGLSRPEATRDGLRSELLAPTWSAGSVGAGGVRSGGVKGFVRAFWRKKLAVAGLAIVVLSVLLTIFVPLFAGSGVDVINLNAQLESPSAAHWLGTDQLGRDYLTRIIYGARYSLMVGAGAVLFGAVIGQLLGFLAGFLGRWGRRVVLVLVDAVASVPMLFLALLLYILAEGGPWGLIVGLTAVVIPWQCRTMCAGLVGTDSGSVVHAGETGDKGRWKQKLRAVYPDALVSCAVAAAMTVGLIVLLHAGLSWMGAKADAIGTDWGYMVADTMPYIRSHPLPFYALATALAVLVISFNLLGNGLRDLFWRTRGAEGGDEA